jgi:flavin reductase (DIM6/NTAB) family NADH-FMN oxidoreductase RutF
VAGLLEELDGEEVIVDPAAAEPRDIYKLMVGAIVPRPIAFVSTLSADGMLNLAPFSFFTAISANPPVVCFCPMIRGSDGKRKDTLNNIEATGEFVVNVVSEEFVEKMNLCAPEYGPEVDEFQVSGLTPVASDLVKPPRVRESRVQMECRLMQALHVSVKPLGGSIVLGEVLRFHVDDFVVAGFAIDPDKLNAVGRMGGPAYSRTRDRFDLERPK